MIDYWEALGRLVSDKALNDKFEAILPPPRSITKVPTAAGKHQGTGLEISAHEYARVQGFIKPLLNERLLSLAAASELISTYSYKSVRDAIAKLNGVIQKTPGRVAEPSASYFVALGALLIDTTIRDGLLANPETIKDDFPRLSKAEQQHLVALIKNVAFRHNAVTFYAKAWPFGCDLAVIFRPGYMHMLSVQNPVDGGAAYGKAVGR